MANEKQGRYEIAAGDRGIDYPSAVTGEPVRREPGDRFDDLPEESAKWLVEDGIVIDHDEESPANTAAESESGTAQEPGAAPEIVESAPAPEPSETSDVAVVDEPTASEAEPEQPESTEPAEAAESPTEPLAGLATSGPAAVPALPWPERTVYHVNQS